MTQCMLFAKRQPGQCKCQWCGQRAGGLGGCRITDTMRDKISYYAAANGPQWRAKLSAAWLRGSEELVDVRNAIGPSGIYAISAKALRIWDKVRST